MENLRVSPLWITELKDNEIYCFGSNFRGAHSLGAAKQSLNWGAKYGQGYGLQGQTFAIPTKDWDIKTLPLYEIKPYVDKFIHFTKTYPQLNFLVTKVGCGLAGYTVKDIAPMFQECLNLENVYLPVEFIEFYNK